MATELQTRANRSNSLKSTGPKTDEGKAAIRLNAVRHGLLSVAPVVAGEFAALCSQLTDELKPKGILETRLVSRIAGTLWRLQRLSHIEAGVLTGAAARTFADAADERAASYTHREGGIGADDLNKLIEELGEGAVVIDDEERHADATDAAQSARAVAWSAPAMLGAAYKEEAGTLDNLARYETNLERTLTRSTEELERLQSARHEREYQL
jgi:hypothetical protein